MTSVTKSVREMTESVIGSSPVKVGGVYQHPSHGAIRIDSGAYWGEHGLSNFWTWTDLATGQCHSGYGAHWPEITSHQSV